jgi:hypothetical protein
VFLEAFCARTRVGRGSKNSGGQGAAPSLGLSRDSLSAGAISRSILARSVPICSRAAVDPRTMVAEGPRWSAPATSQASLQIVISVNQVRLDMPICVNRAMLARERAALASGAVWRMTMRAGDVATPTDIGVASDCAKQGEASPF